MVGFAKTFGYGGLFVGNLFSFVSAIPERLSFGAAPELQGGPNNEAIKKMKLLKK